MPGIAMLRMKGMESTVEFLSVDQDEHTLKFQYLRQAHTNKEDIIDLCQYLLKQDANSWSKRIESSMIDIYTNDSKIFQDLLDKFPHILRSSSQPDTSRAQEYEDQHHIVCEKLPHGRYKYKIYLKPHKLKNDKQAKKEYLAWLDNQSNVLISNAVKKWFLDTDWNWDRRYILVEDHKTLLLLHMRNAEVMGKVYEYVLSDK